MFLTFTFAFSFSFLILFAVISLQFCYDDEIYSLRGDASRQISKRN